MTPAQKAVLQAAENNGCTPMEVSAEFMLHDLVQACIDILRKQTKPYNDLGEQQQDAVNATLQSDLKKTVVTAAHILAGANVVQVPMTLQDFKVGKDLKLTGLIESDDPGRFQLMDLSHNKSKVLILLQDMNYFAGMDNIKADKDQKPLDLEGDSKPAAGKAGKGKAAAAKAEKAIEVAPKMLTDARDFIVIQQNPTVAGLQNFLHIDRTKAEHIHTLMEDEGVLSAKDASGMRQLIRQGDKVTTGNDLDEQQPDLNVPLTGEDSPVELTQAIYELIRDKIIARQVVSVGAIMIDHALPEEAALDAIDRLEMDGVISIEDDLGGRTVLIGAAAE